MAIDYVALFGVDEYDPCLIFRTLRPVYMKLLAEPGVQRVTFRDRTVEYQKSDASGLANLLRQMQAECLAKSGKRSNFAITAGARLPSRLIP